MAVTIARVHALYDDDRYNADRQLKPMYNRSVASWRPHQCGTDAVIGGDNASIDDVE